MAWDASKYVEFESERNVAVLDLIQKTKPFLSKCENILDIGCGPGNSTRLLRENFKDSKMLGVDNSESMLERANSLQIPKCEFRFCDINKDFLSLNSKFDLLFFFFSLHWIKEQARFFKEALELLENEGVLAVQIPLDDKSVFHQILQNLARDFGLNSSKIRVFSSLMMQQYYDILKQNFSDFVLWESTYIHPLENVESIIRWYSGSGLRPYLELVSDKESFTNELLKRLKEQIKPQKDGKVLLQVPRLFFVAKK